MKIIFTLLLMLTLSPSIYAKTISCDSFDNKVGFYFLEGRIDSETGEDSGEVVITPTDGRVQKSEIFLNMSISVEKKRFILITDENDFVNLYAKYNEETGVYIGTLSLSTSLLSYSYSNLNVRCARVN